MSRILVIGYNAFDVVCPAPRRLLRDTKHEVERINVGGGGPGATAAVAMARLGAEVRLVTPLADDMPGRLQYEELRAAGVDVSRSPILKGAESAKAVILFDAARQERTIVWSRGDLPTLDADLYTAEWLEGVDLLYVDGHEADLSLRALAAARKIGLPTVMDAGSVREGSRALVALCTDVVSSTKFAPELTAAEPGLDALQRLSDLGPRHVAMTFGQQGCLALDKDHLVHVPAFEADIYDTTGAGDAFHAGYAFARATGRPWMECLEYGSAVAALKCRSWGGRAGLPVLGEVEELLRTGTRRKERPPCIDNGDNFA